MGVGIGSKLTVLVSLIAFLALQLSVGMVLNAFLAEKVKWPKKDNFQWIWVIADVALLLFGGIWLFRYNTNAAGKELFGLIPPLPLLWMIYLALCLIPRTSWLFKAGGTTMDCVNHNFTLPMDGINAPVQLQLGSNTLVTILSLFNTAMVVLLAIAGYSHFGLRNEEGLDFDMAEAALCLMDGVEFLQAFFDVSNCQSASAATSRIPPVGARPTCVMGNNSPANIELCYLEAIEGVFGAIVICLACFCFFLPVIALWQMRRQSDVQKLERELKKTKEGQGVSKISTISREGVGSRPVSSASGVSSISKSNETVLLVEGEDDHIAMEEERLERLTTERDRLQVLFLIWDCFVINLTGAVVRLYLWLEYKQPISALVAKNILAFIFRFNVLYQNHIQAFLSNCSQGLHAQPKITTDKDEGIPLVDNVDGPEHEGRMKASRVELGRLNKERLSHGNSQREVLYF